MRPPIEASNFLSGEVTLMPPLVSTLGVVAAMFSMFCWVPMLMSDCASVRASSSATLAVSSASCALSAASSALWSAATAAGVAVPRAEASARARKEWRMGTPFADRFGQDRCARFDPKYHPSPWRAAPGAAGVRNKYDRNVT